MDGIEELRSSNCSSEIESHDESLLVKFPGSQWESALPVRQQSHRFHTPVVITLLYTTIIILLATLIWLVFKPLTCSDPSQTIHSPAENVISYETLVFDENFENKGPYMGSPIDGLPTDETDALWEDLYQYGVSAISALDAANLPNKTTSIPGRPNEFVVELDVFHQLHCLNALRKTFYPDRYSSEFEDYFSTNDGRRNYTSTAAQHYDHCIDSIRQSVMCHGDIATVYWQWKGKRRIPLPSLAITHTCRNFEAIKAWAKEHMIVNDDVVLKWQPGPIEDFKLSG